MMACPGGEPENIHLNPIEATAASTTSKIFHDNL